MKNVTPKKRLGQHFLKDKGVALKIVNSIAASNANAIVEVGPGTGILTGLLLERYGSKFYAAEIDAESVEYLRENYPELGKNLFFTDFISLDLSEIASYNMVVVGNFPYNISSQIFFKIFDNRHLVNEVVCMVQREVAQRICEPPGSKTYGILSVLLQAYFNINYLFTVSEGVFFPPPKVKSAVIRLTRNSVKTLGCDERLFIQVVKTGFNQRRKTLRNSLKALLSKSSQEHPLLDKRPEQLSVADFVELTNFIGETGETI
ncbi:MAG TPA: 16S rRNA (adenine(1518)-N(6)/adenine(1519)-N(6))-dimethyltransferase RsmA [Tenuifilaceae bacterium]|jgi:16S rRNA (adenine1518-N6/adenine1519-N6)-dimethyltransferase|nr:16S rRNA (adenine(1518)-N(6)/adenine(1519)-N(6))-dimethyltransferase RsmA [Bacteroidales bacterium]MDI9515386.1 16S rRNA (adenine(1518)-N(6)/adenine(1519)-N(6))-dimethyltransferase RsmA [Bacteroidota bacterium]NLH57258.1 16S rRNA (adenine(1518)-N(6)/adenine(1519)-N(6))-dimethyltransferase RsmA [Rikenellaceae bacterium]OQC62850.1 MAG: Ribosomal RNA small subunit methyltransferase A [Bacteroidetes bacterium ADurb.Bin008]HOF92206.1 16S rRNA (adenine(1518)-N(6)/adenine(1519)-N(6))-dimethyltransf